MHAEDPVADALRFIHAEQIAQRQQLEELKSQIGQLHLLMMNIQLKLTLTSKVYPDEQG